jgi:uncharacterized protein YrrD
MTSDYIRYSEFIDQLVLNRNTLDELGKVEVLWEYPQAHRVLGFICKSGSFERRKTAFNLDQLDTIGANGVLVNSEPVETDAERVKQIQSLVHCEVWTDTGNRVGKIVDHVFHLKTGVIRQYLLSAGGLQGLAGKVYALYPSQILSWGSRRVLVSAAIVEGLEVYQPGLQDRISKFGEVLREEKSQASQGLQSLVSRAKTKAQILAEQAKEQAQVLSTELLESAEQARERVRDLRDELREEFLESDYRNAPRSRGYDDRDVRNRYREDLDYEDRGYDDQRYRDDRYRYDDDFDFDFDQPWEEEAPPRRRNSETDWDQQPIPPRPKLNLEPHPQSRSTQPSPPQSSPQSEHPPKPDRDFDPWDDDWE